MQCRTTLLAVSSVICLLLPPSVPASGEGQVAGQPATPAEALMRSQARIDELRLRIAEDPRDEQAWAALIQLLPFHHAVEAQAEKAAGGSAAGVDAATRARRNQQRLLAEIDTWIATDPFSATARILRARHELDPERRLALFEEAYRSFPASAEVVRAYDMALQQLGRREERLRLFESFYAAHPESPEAHRFLYRHLVREGDARRADAVLDSWLALAPADAEALRYGYEREAAAAEPAARASLARSATERMRPSSAMVAWCDSLARQIDPDLALAEDCYERVLRAAESNAAASEAAARGYAALMGRLGRWHDLGERLATLPPGERDRVLLRVAREARCEEAAALFESMADPARRLVRLAHGLERCLPTRPFRQLLDAALVEGEPATVAALMRGAIGEAVEVEAAEKILRRRLTAAPDDRDLLAALEQLYRHHRRAEELLELLLSRRDRGAPLDSRQLQELASLLAFRGERERAIAILEEALALERHLQSYALRETLAGLYLSQGRDAEAERVASELVRSGERRGAKGYLLLARLALARGDPEGALDLYDRYFGAAPVHEWSSAGEYRELLVELGQSERLAAFVGLEYDKHLEAGQALGDRNLWVADRLEKAGDPELAIRYLERSLAEVSYGLDLQERIARLAEAAGRWERAERARRELLAAQPDAPEAWYRLAKHYDDRGEPERALETLDDAFARLQRDQPGLWTLYADAALHAHGDRETGPDQELLVDAIRLLRRAQERYPDNRAIDARLRALYVALSDLHQSATGASF